MMTVAFGPLVLPAAPLVLLAATATASAVARRRARAVAPAQAEAAGNALAAAALIGLLAARLGDVVLRAGLYIGSPWSVVDLRDGGWWAEAGWLAAAAYLLWRAWRVRVLGGPLLWGAATAALVWAAGYALLLSAGAAPRATAVPAVALSALSTPLASSAPSMSSVSSVSSASSTPQGHPATTTLPAVIAGRPAVVNLWATWCPPCRKEMPLLAQAQAREPGVAFIFVDQGENAEAVRRWLDAQASTLREVWLDPQMRLGAAVGSRGLPTTLFYSAEGQLVSSHVGPLGPVALEAQLRAIRPTVPAR